MLDLAPPEKTRTSAEDGPDLPPSAFRSGQYDTELTPYEETEFQRWMARQSKRLGRDIRMDLHDYDVRGLWLSFAKSGQDLEPGHGVDTFKKPTHPTFSNESIYSNKDTPGGVWWADNTYSPSGWMMSDPERAKYLKQYMKEREPGVKLDLTLANQQRAGLGIAK
jgi:hypothetical protein